MSGAENIATLSSMSLRLSRWSFTEALSVPCIQRPDSHFSTQHVWGFFEGVSNHLGKQDVTL